MKTIVISQPMFFPWPGIFEQVKLADVFVHYSDVQFPQGRSFSSRVQIKTPNGQQWLTVPVVRDGRRLISEVRVNNASNWRDKHLGTLLHNYGKAPFFDEMIELVRQVYDRADDSLSRLNIDSMESVCRYFGIETEMHDSRDVPVGGGSSERLLGICRHFSGDRYVTGWGAKNYLDIGLFERQGVTVHFMDYCKLEYRQQHGDFIPYVSILDLIANEGVDGRRFLSPRTVSAESFMASH